MPRTAVTGSGGGSVRGRREPATRAGAQRVAQRSRLQACGCVGARRQCRAGRGCAAAEPKRASLIVARRAIWLIAGAARPPPVARRATPRPGWLARIPHPASAPTPTSHISDSGPDTVSFHARPAPLTWNPRRPPATLVSPAHHRSQLLACDRRSLASSTRAPHAGACNIIITRLAARLRTLCLP